MPISSRRYLSAYEYVVKYLEFAWKSADSNGFSGINPKYLIPPRRDGISLLRYRLSETAITSLKLGHRRKEVRHFLQLRGSRAGLLKQLIYGGFLAPSAFSSLKLGAAASPIDKVLKDSALPPVASEKSILFFYLASQYWGDMDVFFFHPNYKVRFEIALF
jgi:hypothetical protein